MLLTSKDRVLTRGYYWRIEVLQSWPAQRNEELLAFRSAVREAQESIALCRETRVAADLAIARPPEVAYVCQPIVGYLYPESRRSAIPTDSSPSETGPMIAMLLELVNGAGVLHQWRLSKTTGSVREPDRLN